uniref:F-box protein At2g23160-like n=1 Tax=Erigeron canadensis TaxID=72917 RepID=UPI001CB915A3|nr:F-box protein At2g23160-like [Erigeron canadensis]
MAVALPEDTLYDIYSRIPIKSLARFRCVCKQWHEYINDPHLAKIHNIKEEPKPTHIAQIISSKFQPLVAVLISFLHIVMEDSTAGIMQVKKDSSCKLLLKSFSRSCYCNGLIALVYHDNAYDIATTYVVINPLTKERHQLPLVTRPYEFIIAQGLGFDHSTNTFRMVCVFLKKQLFTGVYIHTALVHVLGTDSWRQIPQVPLCHITGKAVYANGRLYWYSRTSSWDTGSHLVWFDMKTEEFGGVDLPVKQEEGGFLSYKLIDLNGQVGFVYRNRGSNKKVVWILKHEEWTIHCVYDESKPGYCGLSVVLGCWNTAGDLLINFGEGFPLLVYRLKSGRFHKLIGPDDEAGEDKGKAEVRMYQSSLFSIRKWH